VLVRWQCSAVRAQGSAWRREPGAPGGAADAYAPSLSTAGLRSPGGEGRVCGLAYSPPLSRPPPAVLRDPPPGASWLTVSAANGTADPACLFYPQPRRLQIGAVRGAHPFAAWYRVAGVDYWGRYGELV